MPPPGRPRPDAATYRAVAGFLEGELDRAWLTAPNPGRTYAVHRLNRTEYNNAVRDLVCARPRREDAAAWRRHRRRQLRQRRRGVEHLDRAPRTLSLGRPPGDAARDRPSAFGAKPADVRDSAARPAGRSAERRSAIRLARRHRRPLPVPGRRRVRDHDPAAPPVSGLPDGNGLAADARRAARRQAAEALHRRRRRERAPGGGELRRRRRAGLCRRSRMGNLYADRRRRRPRDPPADPGWPAHRRRLVRARAVGAGRAAAAAAARPRADQRSDLHGLRGGRLGSDRRAVPDRSAGCRHAEPPRNLRLQAGRGRRRTRLRHQNPVANRASRVPPSGHTR